MFDENKSINDIKDNLRSIIDNPKVMLRVKFDADTCKKNVYYFTVFDPDYENRITLHITHTYDNILKTSGTFVQGYKFIKNKVAYQCNISIPDTTLFNDINARYTRDEAYKVHRALKKGDTEIKHKIFNNFLKEIKTKTK